MGQSLYELLHDCIVQVVVAKKKAGDSFERLEMIGTGEVPDLPSACTISYMYVKCKQPSFPQEKIYTESVIMYNESQEIETM
jgi:hypothetical protein